MRKIAILMTCHNRREVTLECLRHLNLCAFPAAFSFDIWLNDDRSTDGTGEAVENWACESKSFALHVVKGTGCDYWCGGMRRAWNAALASGTLYDGFIWLNDDTVLFENALILLLESQDAIVVGATCDKKGKKMTYGGKDIWGFNVVPNGSLQEVEILNGNFVFVPRSVFDVLGGFSPYFTHSIGDYDYGKRARAAGISIYTARNFVGTCEQHDKPVAWKDPAQPLHKRLKSLYSPLGGAEPNIFFRYNCEHYGVFLALLRYFKQHLVAVFPARFA